MQVGFRRFHVLAHSMGARCWFSVYEAAQRLFANADAPLEGGAAQAHPVSVCLMNAEYPLRIPLRAMVDVEPYGSSDLGGDPSDDEPPSMTSASPSEDDDPEDPENPSGKKKKKKKTRRPGGRRSQEAKAIATSKIVVNLPEFTGKDLSEFAENFGRFLRLTGQTHASGRVKCDLLLQCCKTKYPEKQVKQIVTKSATFADVLVALER